VFSSARLNPGMRRPNPGMRRLGGFAAGLALLAGTALAVITAPAATATPAAAAAPGTAAPAAPRLSHVFLIMEENNGFQDVIGNKAAPNLNYLAKTFGLETNYFGVSPCCSESNYVQLLGGTSFPTVQSDDAYWKNKVVGTPSLITQLDHAGISWKAYLQSLPYPGYQGICYPAKCDGAGHRPAVRLQARRHPELHQLTEPVRLVPPGAGHAAGRGPEARHRAAVRLHRPRRVH
jgi:hypothetical protein